MPNWIKIEVKDSRRSSTSARASTSRQQKKERGRLPWLLLGLVALVGIAGIGFVLGSRVLANRGVVAVVNGQPISQEELVREQALFVTMSTLTQGRPPAQPPTAFDTLNQMIGDRLKYQAALSAGITVAAAEVEAQISAIESQVGFTEAQLQEALAQAGLDRSVLENWISRQIAISRYVNSVVVQNVPSQLQDAAVRSWSNELQTQADVEIRLGSAGKRRAAKVGEPAPDFALPAPAGETVRLSDFRGQAVLLNFWATWCPPCKIEMPDIEALYQKYGAQGFTVIAVNQQESSAAVQAYFDEMGLSFPVVIDSTGEIFNIYRVVALPTSYFIDADGVVRVQHRGMMTRDQMENYMSQVLPN